MRIRFYEQQVARAPLAGDTEVDIANDVEIHLADDATDEEIEEAARRLTRVQRIIGVARYFETAAIIEEEQA